MRSETPHPRGGQTCSDARSVQKGQSAEREKDHDACDGVETEPLPECFDMYAGLGIKASFQSKGAGARIRGERLPMSLLPRVVSRPSTLLRGGSSAQLAGKASTTDMSYRSGTG